jgi:site-specific recombinase XerD
MCYLGSAFLCRTIIQQKNASPRTIAAYRDTFRMLLCYAEREIGKPPTKLALIDFDVTFILNFLTYLESERHNTIKTRNARLATLRAFAHYLALQCPEALLLTQQIQAIPMKRFEKPMLGFLSREEIQALLEAPDEQTWCGYRDRIVLTLLYNTGARVSELIGIRVADVELTISPSVRLHGKGRRQRTVPLWKETATKIRQ